MKTSYVLLQDVFILKLNKEYLSNTYKIARRLNMQYNIVIIFLRVRWSHG